MNRPFTKTVTSIVVPFETATVIQRSGTIPSEPGAGGSTSATVVVAIVQPPGAENVNVTVMLVAAATDSSVMQLATVSTGTGVVTAGRVREMVFTSPATL